MCNPIYLKLNTFKGGNLYMINPDIKLGEEEWCSSYNTL